MKNKQLTPEEILQWIKNEISCRIEHGANSNGHLEFFHERLKNFNTTQA